MFIQYIYCVFPIKEACIRSVSLCFHLFVHGSHDGSTDFHAQHEAALEVLLQEEGLQQGHQEQQHGVDVAHPQERALVVGEVDHQPGKTRGGG